MRVGRGPIAGEFGIYVRGAGEGVGEGLEILGKWRISWTDSGEEDWDKDGVMIYEVRNDTSRTKTAAPSPMINPLRAASKGRDARWGALLKVVDSEWERSKPVNTSGWMQDSALPASMTSASPKAINREASPMEWAPVVQAVLTA